MLFDIVPVLLLFSGIVLILIVVGRRLPDIASLDVERSTTSSHAKRKRELIRDRLDVRLRGVVRQLTRRVGVLSQRAGDVTGQLRQSMARLESKHRSTPARSKTAQQQLATRTEDKLRTAEEQQVAGDYHKAEDEFIAVIGKDPHNVAAYRGLAEVYRKTGQEKEAREALEYATELAPDEADIRAELGGLMEEAGDLEGAEEMLREAIILSPDDPEYRVALGDVALKQHDFSKAIGIFEEAVVVAPANPRCLDRLIEACILGGNKRLANETLKRLKEVNPDNQKVLEFKKRIAALRARRRKSSDG